MTAFAAFVSLCNSLWTLITNLFGKKKSEAQASENTQAVEVSNQVGKVSGETARATEKETDQEIAKNDQQTKLDVARVDSAVSLRDENDSVADAIARTRAHPRASD